MRKIILTLKNITAEEGGKVLSGTIFLKTKPVAEFVLDDDYFVMNEKSPLTTEDLVALTKSNPLILEKTIEGLCRYLCVLTYLKKTIRKSLKKYPNGHFYLGMAKMPDGHLKYYSFRSTLGRDDEEKINAILDTNVVQKGGEVIKDFPKTIIKTVEQVDEMLVLNLED